MKLQHRQYYRKGQARRERKGSKQTPEESKQENEKQKSKQVYSNETRAEI
jgi:hypothetical protein